MKLMTILCSLVFSFSAISHDEGHGPAIKDESLKGGKVSAIILEKDVKKGRKAEMLYKGELVHEPKGTDVKLYLYTKDMKPLDLTKFAPKAKAVQIERGKTEEFVLSLDESGKFFKGQRPKNKRVPFNIDVFVGENDKSLFGAFDGLD